MRDKLRALARLAKMDEAARAIESELTELPKRLEALRADVRRLAERLEKERADLQEVERMRASHEQELETRREQLAQARAKVNRSRTAREAEAADREVEGLRRTIREREEELLKLEEAFEAGKERLEAHEKALGEVEAALADEEKEIEARLVTLRSQLEKETQGRDELVSLLGAPVVRHYERVRARRGTGVAFIENEMCSGCKMTLPSQLFVKVQRGESLERCPQCLRWVVYEPEPERPELSPGAEAALEEVAAAREGS